MIKEQDDCKKEENKDKNVEQSFEDYFENMIKEQDTKYEALNKNKQEQNKNINEILVTNKNIEMNDDLLVDYLSAQRKVQENSRQKIKENLDLIQKSQDKYEKEIKQNIKDLGFNENDFTQSITSIQQK